MSIEAKITCFYQQSLVQCESRGREVTVRRLPGAVQGFQVTNKSADLANIEGSALLRAFDRDIHLAWIRNDVWKEMPESSKWGLGNRGNPLEPWLHCAADQRKYPYGTRIQVPKKCLDRMGLIDFLGPKFFYVADKGGGVRGNHFDLFVPPGTKPFKFTAEVEVEPPINCLYMGFDEPETSKWGSSEWQRALNLAGAFPKLKIDGNFGPKSIAALREFQARVGLGMTLEYGVPGTPATCWWLAKKASET